jgi:hypothetical protein
LQIIDIRQFAEGGLSAVRSNAFSGFQAETAINPNLLGAGFEKGFQNSYSELAPGFPVQSPVRVFGGDSLKARSLSETQRCFAQKHFR